MRIALSLLACVLLCASAIAAEPQNVIVRASTDSEAPGYEGYRALDGDPNTMWHTRWQSNETKHPHDLTIDLGASRSIAGFSYLPRKGGGNGTIKDYEFYVSQDGKKFGKPVSQGAFKYRNAENVIQFAKATKARYIRLRSLTETHGLKWASVAELTVHSEGFNFRARKTKVEPPPPISRPATETELQFLTLKDDLSNRARILQHADQVFHPEALVLESDRDPVDIVLRRTTALLNDLQLDDDTPDLSKQAKALGKLRVECAKVDIADNDARFDLFKRLCAVRREIAFSNPLLDFDKVLFLKRHRSTFNHMCDQYYAVNALPGGGVFELSDPFGDSPKERDITAGAVVESGKLKGQKLEGGSFLSPDLSYDGKSLLFAYTECKGDTAHDYHVDPSRGHWAEGRCYHLFSVGVDGSGLAQLTDGTFNDFDPLWMPNGRVAFISERRGGYLRCGRVCPTYTLYDMRPNGDDIRILSPHETNEWHPSIDNTGMIVYTRWDYVDRHGCVAHLPWTTTPDGRDARALHGNFAPREKRADMELDVRAIPGSHKFVATGAPHHGQSFGSLVVFDPQVEDDDAMAPIKRLTPEIAFPESQGGAQVYGTPWPLSETYFLAAYDPLMQPGAGRQGKKHSRGEYSLYLVDAFGNKELIHRDPDIAIQNPMPLRARQTPPTAPEASMRLADNPPTTATLAVVNVYDSLKPWPEGSNVTALRVIQVLPMTVPSGKPPHEVGMRLPGAEGSDSVIIARSVLGTVPIEDDGSAHFVVPAGKELFFQALDEKGLAIQSMRSATYLQPGETLTCHGCHDPRYRVPTRSQQGAKALGRKPSTIAPDVDGTAPFSYPRLVQPVLEKNCLSCHQKHPDKAPDLSRDVVTKGKRGGGKWYASYWSLAPEYGFWSYGDRFRTTPGKFGARASKLYAMLEKGHHDVDLSDEDLHRITLWLDCCSIFYGVYEKDGGEAQLRGEIAMPTLE